MKDHLYTALLLIFVVVILGVQLVGWNNCSNDGGEYVRGMFWMKCVDTDD